MVEKRLKKDYSLIIVAMVSLVAIVILVSNSNGNIVGVGTSDFRLVSQVEVPQRDIVVFPSLSSTLWDRFMDSLMRWRVDKVCDVDGFADSLLNYQDLDEVSARVLALRYGCDDLITGYSYKSTDYQDSGSRDSLGLLVRKTTGSRDQCIFGDMNSDGGWNVLDIVSLANCVLAGNCGNLDCSCSGDVNSDGGWNVLDIVTLANC